MPSPHISLPLNINLKTKRPDLLTGLGDEIANPAQGIPKIVIIHRLSDLSEVGNGDGHVVVAGQYVFVSEVAVGDEVVASSVESDFEDEREGEAQALEHVSGWEFGAEVVEEEGCWGSFDGVGD